jgi:steroid delta-isomerase-like uncharacterized protein
MSIDQNKALANRVLGEIFNGGNVKLVDELFAPTFVERELLPPGTPSGLDGVKALPVVFHTAFPDFKITINDVMAEGEKVMVRSTWSGTHKGEFMGIPPTGKNVSFGVFDVLRFDGGKVVEHWGLMDSAVMMQQLGVTG